MRCTAIIQSVSKRKAKDINEFVVGIFLLIPFDTEPDGMKIVQYLIHRIHV